MGLAKTLGWTSRAVQLAAGQLATRQLAGELSAASSSGSDGVPRCPQPPPEPKRTRVCGDATSEPYEVSLNPQIWSTCASELPLRLAGADRPPALTLQPRHTTGMAGKGPLRGLAGACEPRTGESTATFELDQLKRHSQRQMAARSTSLLSQPGAALTRRGFSSESMFAAARDEPGLGRDGDGMAGTGESKNLEQRPGRRMNLFTAINDALATALDSDPRYGSPLMCCLLLLQEVANLESVFCCNFCDTFMSQRYAQSMPTGPCP